jgi:hypothetical protein
MLQLETTRAILRASGRAAALAHEDLKRGVNSLATIATIAPMVGFFGTVLLLVTSFRGFGTESSAIRRYFLDELSGALLFAALGLLIAIQAKWFYTYLSDALETLDRQMLNTASELVNELSRNSDKFGLAQANGGNRAMSSLSEYAGAGSEPTFRKWCVAFSIFLLAVAWLFRVLALVLHNYYPIADAGRSSIVVIPLMFVVCLAPAHPIWKRQTHGRPGDHTLLASGLCLIWSVLEYCLHSHVF